mmetsp:Transcript_7295/g.13162  ORF Transcript_7295/g.13162 Transcript_7295/m.13162 type:complete len:444 (-) Transcript_7295:329-1660(-)|eukprot:CAMPEP_0182448536 /NCGR_PEP_ID=MMETSP1172-20130603/27915_1 /TAXON_ID=708627 /ORGANISM="Timspurckia oligopyrenoides, Strain CCMP3278" /LENGTH=443 /DNA_ID=CAMNT_0024645445 /DNA_START=268 /DNA_END=1599 /DNA_ORIENTATION=-
MLLIVTLLVLAIASIAKGQVIADVNAKVYYKYTGSYRSCSTNQFRTRITYTRSVNYAPVTETRQRTRERKWYWYSLSNTIKHDEFNFVVSWDDLRDFSVYVEKAGIDKGTDVIGLGQNRKAGYIFKLDGVSGEFDNDNTIKSSHMFNSGNCEVITELKFTYRKITNDQVKAYVDNGWPYYNVYALAFTPTLMYYHGVNVEGQLCYSLTKIEDIFMDISVQRKHVAASQNMYDHAKFENPQSMTTSTVTCGFADLYHKKLTGSSAYVREAPDLKWWVHQVNDYNTMATFKMTLADHHHPDYIPEGETALGFPREVVYDIDLSKVHGSVMDTALWVDKCHQLVLQPYFKTINREDQTKNMIDITNSRTPEYNQKYIDAWIDDWGGAERNDLKQCVQNLETTNEKCGRMDILDYVRLFNEDCADENCPINEESNWKKTITIANYDC